MFVDEAAQTDWHYPRNAATQYQARQFTEEETAEIEQREDYMDFMNTVVPRYEHGVTNIQTTRSQGPNDLL